MASHANPNTLTGGTFDMQSLFKSSTPPSQNPNPQFPNNNSATGNPNMVSAPFPLPSASYPQPTGGGAPYPFPPQTASPFHHQHVYHHNYNEEFDNVHPQRSISNPAPNLQPQMQQVHNSQNHHNFQNQTNSQNPNPGARLMALLSQPAAGMPPQIHPTSSAGSDFSVPQNVHMMPTGGLVVPHQGGMMRMPSSKLPRGRHLIGDDLVYDIDVKLPGEVQPQLEVTSITKYGSDPGLVLGRQIAVNKSYICYGLKLGAIRVLNINTALKSLLKSLTQRVTDMAFFAEDVHLLACAGVDGRVYAWKITEGPDEEDKPQITGRIVIAVQITGSVEDVHPRVCWHRHKQEVLVAGVGKHVLKINATKVGKKGSFSAEEPLRCPIDKLIDGVQLVGSHDREVTDLSMCQWMTTRLVSASVDGTIKIWEDRNSVPIAVLRPHDGQPVNSVAFLAHPNRPDHIILITGGPLNREIKIWASASGEGFLLFSDADSWNCTQTLELKSSGARLEEAFFNQVVDLSQASLLLLSNAKRNAIYAIHIEYGPSPAATRMDYLAEFTVTMPILSFTGTSELLPHGEQTVQVYCVQTQAIQQYALNLSQCLPPLMENVVLQKSDSSISLSADNTQGLAKVKPPASRTTEIPVANSAPKASMRESALGNAASARSSIQEFASSSMGSKLVPLSTVASNSDISSVNSPPPQSPRVARTLSSLSANDHGEEPKIAEYSVDRQMDTIHANLSDVASLDGNARGDDTKYSQEDISMGLNSPIKFKHPTHLVTPSEILRANSKSEAELNIQDVVVSNDTRNAVIEVQVVGETRFSQNNNMETPEDTPTSVSENNEKSFYSQASDLGMEMAIEFHMLSPETYVVEETQQFDGNVVDDKFAQPSTVEEVHDSANDTPGKIIDSSTPVPVQQPTPNSKGKRQKGKSGHMSDPSSASPSAVNSTDSYTKPGISSSTAVETALSQISSMQQILNQLVTAQKEFQKEMEMMVAVPVTKEGKRVEAALGQSLEKSFKASSDALWVRFHEENVKRAKTAREHTQQITNMINNCLNKDYPSIIEKTLKRELVAVGQSVARKITPAIEKIIRSSIAESFQRGVCDKAVNQLEKSVNSKLETIVARQIQAQFQTSGKQALQETLKSSLEASVVPSFEKSCRAMFEQVDATFKKGIVEHTSAAQQQFEASHSPLALTLRDAINSASSMTQTLSTELLDGQRNVLALAVAGANSKVANPLISQLSNGPLGAIHEKIEVPLDPTKELSRLIGERKYEEAFTTALQRSNVTIVSWLCSQVDLPGVLTMNPLPLSQGVLISLLQQSACDVSKETSQKLTWMREVLSVINPSDPMITVHVRPIFDQVYQILNHHRNIPTTSGAELSSIRLIMHVIHSMLMSMK